MQLAEAKKLDPTNPFIVAFEERIAIFEKKGPQGEEAVKEPSKGENALPGKQEAVEKVAQAEEPGQERLEQNLRQQIETEYKERYTQELRKAEEEAAKLVADERAKIEQHQQALQAKHDRQIEELRKQLEREYRQKSEEGVAKAEQQLEHKYQTELSARENELRTQMAAQYATDWQQLEERLKQEQEEVLEKERKSFQEREQKMVKQFEEKLLAEVEKTESVLRERNLGQQKIEEDKLRQSLAGELQMALAKEREALLLQFNNKRAALEESFAAKEQKLKEDGDRKLEVQLALMRKKEAAEFEQKREALRGEIEGELREKFEKEVAEERKRIQHETSKEIDAASQKVRQEEDRKLLEEERAKVAEHEKELEKKHKQQLVDARKQLEEEFNRKIEERVSSEEKRLEKHSKEELTKAEKDLASRLKEQHDAELKALKERLGHQQADLVEKERIAFQEREHAMKEKFDLKLLESLRKTEALFREQNVQQQQIEAEKIRAQLTAEFQANLNRERELMKQQTEATKASLEASFVTKQHELQSQSDRYIQEQSTGLKKKMEEEFEREKAALRKEFEAEYGQKYEERIGEERGRIQQAADKELAEGKRKLQEEHEAMIAKQNENLQRIRSELRSEMEETFFRRMERVAQEYDHKMELLGVKVPATSAGRVELYREKMRACYTEGEPSVEDAKMLMELKELLEITFDQHLAIESDVRLELYVANVEKKILSGSMKLGDADPLETIKRKFRISAEEANKLEPYFLSRFQRLAMKARILLVDDDVMLLESMHDLLTESGYQVVTAPDIKAGLEKLSTEPVDLILSDIKFGAGELDGFQFFKMVQEKPQWWNLPFVFMSALVDGVIIRSGVQLGVDDYLTKPIDPDLLVAVIEGKLKRYRTFERN